MSKTEDLILQDSEEEQIEQRDDGWPFFYFDFLDFAGLAVFLFLFGSVVYALLRK